MGIREVINEKPIIPIAVLGVLIVAIAGYFLFLRDTGNYGGTDVVFASTDDGETFVEYATNGALPPWTIGGEEAVRAYVFQDRVTDEQFIGFLETYPADAAISAAAAAGVGVRADMANVGGAMVKRPGDAEWVSVDDDPQAAMEIKRVRESPAGNGIMTVMPYDLN
jgi:hypothetical protein